MTLKGTVQGIPFSCWLDLLVHKKKKQFWKANNMSPYIQLFIPIQALELKLSLMCCIIKVMSIIH